MTEIEGWVRKYSVEKAKTLDKVAQELDISRRQLYNIMNGTTKNEKVKAKIKKMVDSLVDKEEIPPEVLERKECANHLNVIIRYSRMLSEKEMRELAISVRTKALRYFEALH